MSTISVAGSTAATTGRAATASHETFTAASPRTAAETQSSVSSVARPLRAIAPASACSARLATAWIALGMHRKTGFGGKDIGRHLAQEGAGVIQGESELARLAALGPLLAVEEGDRFLVTGKSGAIVVGHERGWPAMVDHEGSPFGFSKLFREIRSRADASCALPRAGRCSVEPGSRMIPVPCTCRRIMTRGCSAKTQGFGFHRAGSAAKMSEERGGRPRFLGMAVLSRLLLTNWVWDPSDGSAYVRPIYAGSCHRPQPARVRAPLPWFGRCGRGWRRICA